jgi:molybdate-binding protein
MQVMPPGGLAFVHIAAISVGVASREDCDIDDLLKKRWINAKKDSAARSFFDKLILSRGLDPLKVDGFWNEASGPAAVVAAIANKTADAGICSSGGAASAGLRFMPLGYEQYELAIHPDLLADGKVGALISAIRSAGFLHRLSLYPGYDTTRTGTLHTITADCRATGIEDPFYLNGYHV